jgi:hypothetical protein
MGEGGAANGAKGYSMIALSAATTATQAEFPHIQAVKPSC